MWPYVPQVSVWPTHSAQRRVRSSTSARSVPVAWSAGPIITSTAPFSELVVDTEDLVGPVDGNGHQWHPGAGRQPSRPGLEPGITEFLNADALGEQTDHATGFEMGQALTHRPQRDRAAANGDGPPAIQGPVERLVVPEEVDESDESGPFAVDRSDQRRIEKGVVVGGQDERRRGEPRPPVDPQPPQDPGSESYRRERDQPPQTMPGFRRVGPRQGSSRTLPVVCLPSSARWASAASASGYPWPMRTSTSPDWTQEKRSEQRDSSSSLVWR